LRAKVAEMCELAERALRDCVKALVEDNRQLAYGIILRDDFIDEKEKELDRLCLEFLVRQQPVAGMLRLAYSTIKINQELEQMGDYAENIARQSLKLGPLPPAVSKERYVELAELSITMVHDAVQAFLRQDAELARKTIEVEEAVDTLKSKLNTDMVELYREQKIPFESLRPLTTIARRLERVSDRARNICLEVLYVCTGEYAKHQGSEVFRILFVDEHDACRSQMAQAIASALNQPHFIFTSAGLEPSSLDPQTVSFLKEKGFDISRVAPRGLFQVPNLDHYQVIVGLAPEVQRALPRLPRRVIFLDWSRQDPSQSKGSPEEIRAAFQETYSFFEAHVRALVEAILGTKVNSK
ncbi:MAG: phosphate signaling complex protein PhoU, partial [Deltaproteobacteria bacterium]|nr:phosphate signaling complex protein PhoU [Deltaproteobacteria bacterium]